MYKRYIKKFNLKKQVGIAMKSKETSSQLELVRNSYVTIMHQPIIDSSNTCSQMHVQIQHSLAHLEDLSPTLAGIKYISNNTSQSRDLILWMC